MHEVLNIVGPIFLVIGAGFICVRTGLFTKTETRSFGRFVVMLALPALLFNALSAHALREVLDLDFLFAYGLGSILVLAGAVARERWYRKRTMQSSAIVGLGMAFANTGFIGYPIAAQVVGASADIALALALIVENVLILPLVLILAELGANQESGRDGLTVMRKVFSSLLRTPLILAILAGVALSALEVRPPEVVQRAIGMFAKAAGVMALFAVGGTLVGLEIKGKEMIRNVAKVAIGKLVLHPLMVLVSLAFLFPVRKELLISGVILACAPMLSVYPIIAQRYGQEERAAPVLLGATAASFFSIFAVLWSMSNRSLF